MTETSEVMTEEECLGEVDRAVREVRSTLSALAQELKLTGDLMGLCTLIDRLEFSVTGASGESAFIYDEEQQKVWFRASVIQAIAYSTGELPDDLQFADRTRQMAVNLFVIHEIVHIQQNFPHHATVGKIKAGLPGIGLPLLDLAADLLAAWVCAYVEDFRVAEDGMVLQHYANCLMISYFIGSVVYDSRTKPEKRQRMIGIVISLALTQAKYEGMLNESRLSPSWQPLTPVFPLNIDNSGTFNAVVMGGVPGLLLPDGNYATKEQLQEIWDSVGNSSIRKTIFIIYSILMAAGIITTMPITHSSAD